MITNPPHELIKFPVVHTTNIIFLFLAQINFPPPVIRNPSHGHAEHALGKPAFKNVENCLSHAASLCFWIGVRNWEVAELYSLDESSFSRVRPVYGLVFLFKWTAEGDERLATQAESEPGLFFAHQVGSHC